MMKKSYVSPTTDCFVVETQELMGASNPSSVLDPTKDDQWITPDDEYNGKFRSRRGHSEWDDDEFEDEY
ncbi:MAG: hypothetical protein IJV24_02985 [Prevotella sp.]|nr:hypothetical protein [Prevotella sp.]